MNKFDTEIQKIKADLAIPANLDGPNWLTEELIKLSFLNYEVGVAMSQAELRENESAINLLKAPLESTDKKLSVAEAEKRAVVETKNEYGLLKNQSTAIVEIINTIKKRIEILSWEFAQAKQ